MTVSAPYYGENTAMRTPPPDLPSLLLKERIVYLGLPLFSDDDAKRQLGMDVTELIIAQLLYLEFESIICQLQDHLQKKILELREEEELHSALYSRYN